MAPLVTRSGLLKILCLAFFSLLVLPFTPGFKQHRNLRLAQAYTDQMRPLIQTDGRFAHIKLEPYTGSGGSLLVFGETANGDDRAELLRMVTSHHPPVEVLFRVSEHIEPYLRPEEATGPAKN